MSNKASKPVTADQWDDKDFAATNAAQSQYAIVIDKRDAQEAGIRVHVHEDAIIFETRGAWPDMAIAAFDELGNQLNLSHADREQLSITISQMTVWATLRKLAHRY